MVNPETSFSQSTKSDQNGSYQFLQVPPGTYTLTVEQSSFGTLKQEGLQLLVNVPTTSNITLKVHAENSVVEVNTQATQVNTQDATVGNAFETAQIAALPFEGRDPVQILSLQPGVTFVGTNVDQKFDSRGGSSQTEREAIKRTSCSTASTTMIRPKDSLFRVRCARRWIRCKSFA